MSNVIVQPRIVIAVGLARTPQSCSARKEAERRLKRLVAGVLMDPKLKLRVETRNRWLHESFQTINWLCGFGNFLIRGGSIGNTFENDLMLLIFQATAIANVADNAASSPLTNIATALHTADPGETGTQSTSESAYTSYARVSVARTSGGWAVTANSVSPVATISFPAGTGGSGTVTHFSVGPTGGGATKIFFSGTVSPNIVTGNGITPQLTTASTITID